MKTSELTGAALDWAVAKCEPDDTVRIYFDEDTGEKLCHDDWDIPLEIHCFWRMAAAQWARYMTITHLK